MFSRKTAKRSVYQRLPSKLGKGCALPMTTNYFPNARNFRIENFNVYASSPGPLKGKSVS